MSRSHIHFATQPQLLRANSWASVMLRLKLQVGRALRSDLWLHLVSWGAEWRRQQQQQRLQ